MIGAENGLGYAAPAFDLVILDCDGVLVDSEQGVAHQNFDI